jgi:hypothetical protein
MTILSAYLLLAVLPAGAAGTFVRVPPRGAFVMPAAPVAPTGLGSIAQPRPPVSVSIGPAATFAPPTAQLAVSPAATLQAPLWTAPAPLAPESVGPAMEAMRRGGLRSRDGAMIFGGDEAAYRSWVESRPGPAELWPLLSGLYQSLRAAYDVDLPAKERELVSRALHARAAGFLARAAADPALDPELRARAADTRERYLLGDGLLSAFAWGRQEKLRAAEARALISAPAAGDVLELGAGPAWTPPSGSERVPRKAGSGTATSRRDLVADSRRQAYELSRFESAVARRRIGRSIPLSPRVRAAEERRWLKAEKAFGDWLSWYQGSVHYHRDASVRTDFGQVDRATHLNRSPFLRLERTWRGYRLKAVMETRITDPIVLAAVRRSIEGYWRGHFEEDGRRRRFETSLELRVLGADEPFSAGALKLEEGSSSSASVGGIRLSRSFHLSTPAHEFGHVLGLRDEYVTRYDPAAMAFAQTNDLSSLMASGGGLVQERHLALVVELLRKAGRLQ